MQLFPKAKKGELAPIALITAGLFGVFILGLITVVLLIVLGQFSSNTTLAPANSAAANAITSTSNAVAGVPTWFTVLITVIIAVGVVLLVMYVRSATQGGGTNSM